MYTAVFFAPKAGPESVVESQALIGLIIPECWVATRITLDVEQRDCGNEESQPNCRWPKIAEWPAYKAAQKEYGRGSGSWPLPTTSDLKALWNVSSMRFHGVQIAAPTNVR
jgi:hypothetical protein